MLVAVQLSVLGLYLPPVLNNSSDHHIRPRRSFHCRSTLRCERFAQLGALMVLVAPQASLHVPSRFEGVCYCWKSITDRAVVDLFYENYLTRVTAELVFWDASAELKRRSASTGRARHSAMTNGSLPSA